MYDVSRLGLPGELRHVVQVSEPANQNKGHSRAVTATVLDTLATTDDLYHMS